MKPVVEDFLPYVNECVKSINDFCSANENATRVPRSLGWTDFTVFGYQGRRKLITFDQWKIQSPLKVLEESEGGDRIRIVELLRKVGASDSLLDVELLNPLVRQNFKEVLRSKL